jgi:aryl-alcohol dehydrogenase-like predicted oxidoreductase
MMARMDHRTLGAAGPAVSLLGLGCNNFGGRIGFDATRAVVHRALDLGVTLFDTADNYGGGGSEEFLGRILGPRRKDVIIATKFGMSGGASRRHVLGAVEASLKRLATDWIDLYQLHRPDPATPIAETLGALDTLVRAGKVRQIGCSYLTGAEFERSCQAAAKAGVPPFATCQNEYSLLVRGIERDLVPAMAAQGAGFLPYLPLAGGLLTGKYRRDAPLPEGARLSGGGWPAGRILTAANWRIVERLEAFCVARGKSLLALAMSWLAAHPFVTSIIAGATRPEQVAANLAALSWRLSPEEMAEIDRLTLTP